MQRCPVLVLHVFGYVQLALCAGFQHHVIPGRHIDGQDALVQPVQVDLDLDAGFLFGIRFFFRGLIRRFILFRIGAAFGFIALRQERRRFPFFQDHKIHRPPDGALNGAHVEPAGGQRQVGARQEVEVFAVRVPGRRNRVGQAVGQLQRFGLVDRPGENGVVLAFQPSGIRDPFGIRRPDRVDGPFGVQEKVLIHQGCFAG